MVKQRKINGDVRRQAIAVLSDGDDTASLVGYDDVLDLAKQSGITIYTITLKTGSAVRHAATSGRRYFSQSEFAMKSLAQETGARAFFPTEIRELTGVYGMIAEELANQYAIGYSSKNPRRDGGFRRVIVRVAERPSARARTRSGYLAARNTAHQTP
jgi:Ca-activated chloride channel family protein